MAVSEVCGVKQAREVAIAGLQHGEGVWRPLRHLATARVAMGCSGTSVVCGSCHTGHGVQCGGVLLQPHSSPGPCDGSLVAEGWGGLWRGLGRSSRKGDKESNFGGMRVNISLWCGGHDLLQLRPGGRE